MIRWILLGGTNIRSNPSFFGSLVRGLGVMIVTLSAFFVFNLGITSFYDKLIVEGRNEVWVTAALDSAHPEAAPQWSGESAADIEILDKTEHLLPPVISESLDIPAFLEESGYKILADRVSLQVDGAYHQGIDDNSFDFFSGLGIPPQPVPFNVGLFLESGSVLRSNQVRHFQYLHNRSPLLAGREMLVPGEMMMSGYMLEKFGISNGGNYIGKEMRFEADGIFLFQAVLTGVLDPEFFRLPDTSGNEQILLMGDMRECMRLGVTQLYGCYEIDAYENSETVRKHLQSQGVSERVTHNEDISETYYYLVRIRELLQSVLWCAVVFILAAAVLNLFSLLWIQLSRREPYNAICRAMGMPHRGISVVLGTEILSAAVLSAIVSSVLSVLLVYGLNRVADSLTGISITLSGEEVAGIIGLTSSGVGVMVFGMAWLISLYLKRTPVAARLRKE